MFTQKPICNFIRNSEILKAAQVSFNLWVGEQTEVYPYNRINIFSYRKESTIAAYNEMVLKGIILRGRGNPRRLPV